MATNKRLIKSNDEAAGGASFNTVVWAGDGNTDRSITVDFAPDWVWVKERNPEGLSHNMYDVVRGAGQRLISNLTAEENTLAEGVKSFDLNGFTVGNSIAVNRSGSTFVAWCWKAAGYANTFNVLENGSTTSSATAGGAGITEGTYTTNYSVSANRDAGFSIVKYNKPVSTSGTVGHGLNTTPQLIIGKSLDVTENWSVNTSLIDGSWDYAFLNLTDQFNNSSLSSPNSSIFYATAGASTSDYIAYCFAEVPGFSKFGSYVGQSGDTSGYINCGFEPAFLMYKRYDGGGDWYMVDNKRGTGIILRAQSSAAEQTINQVTFDALGFTINGSTATNGESSIYMAFANQF